MKAGKPPTHHRLSQPLELGQEKILELLINDNDDNDYYYYNERNLWCAFSPCNTLHTNAVQTGQFRLFASHRPFSLFAYQTSCRHSDKLTLPGALHTGGV